MVKCIVDFIENEIVRDNEPSNQFLVQFYPHDKKKKIVGKFLLPYLGEEINNFNINNVIFVNNHFQILIGY